MQTIIVIHNSEATRTLSTIHRKQTHSLIIHTHQLPEACSLFRMNIRRMQLRTQRSEASIEQIEVISLMIIFQIGIKPQEARKTHQKDQMKIGKAILALIQPNDRMLQIREQRPILRLFANGSIKEFCEKHCHCRLIRIVRNRGKRIKRLCLFHSVESRIRTIVRLKLNKRKRLKQYGFHRRLPRTRHGNEKRCPAGQLRVHLYNDRCIVVFQRM